MKSQHNETLNPGAKHLVWVLPALTLLIPAGCATTRVAAQPDREHEIVYYVDGAGGGGPIADWSRGVRAGLRQAGYRGAFVNYVWQTGLGALADQQTSKAYKRSKATGLARLIKQHLDEHPNAEVCIIALSAGTAIAVFALEALPMDRQVHDVFLLGSSMSANYDLTAALKRVRHHMYVYTSPDDSVLSFFVPLTGTADRRFCGQCSAGLYGFRMPTDADAETRRLYSKVENIAPKTGIDTQNDTVGHTGQAGARFIRERVAPLILHEGPRFTIADSGANMSPPESASTRPSLN
ncbi:MAG: alpha/beta hydrolase [Phycisphaerae bacterium]